MVNIDPSTPQLTVVKKWLESYTSLDTKNIEPLLSKNYQCQRFPRSSELPDQTKKTHLEAWGARFALVEKFEIVCREVIEAPGKVVVLPSITFHTLSKDKFSFDVVFLLTLAEEDEELKILNCKTFADAKKCKDFFLSLSPSSRPQPGFGGNDQTPTVPPNTAFPNSPTNDNTPLNRSNRGSGPSPMGERMLKGHFDGFN